MNPSNTKIRQPGGFRDNAKSAVADEAASDADAKEPDDRLVSGFGAHRAWLIMALIARVCRRSGWALVLRWHAAHSLPWLKTVGEYPLGDGDASILAFDIVQHGVNAAPNATHAGLALRF